MSRDSIVSASPSSLPASSSSSASSFTQLPPLLECPPSKRVRFDSPVRAQIVEIDLQDDDEGGDTDLASLDPSHDSLTGWPVRSSASSAFPTSTERLVCEACTFINVELCGGNSACAMCDSPLPLPKKSPSLSSTASSAVALTSAVNASSSLTSSSVPPSSSSSSSSSTSSAPLPPSPSHSPAPASHPPPPPPAAAPAVSPEQPAGFAKTLTTGSFVDLYCADERWRAAEVSRDTAEAVFVHCIGWTSEWGQWIERNDRRLRPARSCTTSDTGPKKQPTPVEQLIAQPDHTSASVSGAPLLLRGLRECVTGIKSAERNALMRLVQAEGGEYATSFNAACTHLIARAAEASKYQAARAWGVPIMSKEWLHTCVRMRRVVNEAEWTMMAQKAEKEEKRMEVVPAPLAVSTSSSSAASVDSSLPSSPSSSLNSLAPALPHSEQAAEVKLKEEAHSNPKPPPAFQPVTSSCEAVEAAISALRQQISLSLPLASPPPSVSANDQHSLAPVRLVCTELTNQLALSAHLQLACRSLVDATAANTVRVTELMQQQRDRDALLLATLTQLTSGSVTQPRAAVDAHSGEEKSEAEQENEEDDENEDAKRAEVEQAAEEEASLCDVCKDAPCDALLESCRHISCCVKCARQLKKDKGSCPRCNKKIHKVIAVNR